LKEIKQLKGLRSLYVSGHQITDVGLRELKELKRLRSLHLYGSKATHAGVAELKKAVPGLAVRY
jgi:hypothetical protein